MYDLCDLCVTMCDAYVIYKLENVDLKVTKH